MRYTEAREIILEALVDDPVEPGQGKAPTIRGRRPPTAPTWRPRPGFEKPWNLNSGGSPEFHAQQHYAPWDVRNPEYDPTSHPGNTPQRPPNQRSDSLWLSGMGNTTLSSPSPLDIPSSMPRPSLSRNVSNGISPVIGTDGSRANPVHAGFASAYLGDPENGKNAMRQTWKYTKSMAASRGGPGKIMMGMGGSKGSAAQAYSNNSTQTISVGGDNTQLWGQEEGLGESTNNTQNFTKENTMKYQTARELIAEAITYILQEAKGGDMSPVPTKPAPNFRNPLNIPGRPGYRHPFDGFEPSWGKPGNQSPQTPSIPSIPQLPPDLQDRRPGWERFLDPNGNLRRPPSRPQWRSAKGAKGAKGAKPGGIGTPVAKPAGDVGGGAVPSTGALGEMRRYKGTR